MLHGLWVGGGLRAYADIVVCICVDNESSKNPIFESEAGMRTGQRRVGGEASTDAAYRRQGLLSTDPRKPRTMPRARSHRMWEEDGWR